MLMWIAARGQPRFDLTDEEYDANVRPGCIEISFQRGHAEWLDDRYGLDTGSRAEQSR